MESELLKLSNTLVNYSLKVKEGERVLISCNSIVKINYKYFIYCMQFKKFYSYKSSKVS